MAGLYEKPLYPTQRGVVAPPAPRTGAPVQNAGGIPNPKTPSTFSFVAPPGVNQNAPGKPATGAGGTSAGSFFLGAGAAGSGNPSVFSTPDVGVPAAPAPPQAAPVTTPAPAAGSGGNGAPATGTPAPQAASGGYIAGPMNAQHYDPAIHGPYDEWKAKQKAYRESFGLGSQRQQYQEGQDWEILGWLQSHPRANEQQFRSFLENNLGLAMQKDQGMARLKSLLMDFNNTIDGNYHYDLEKGMKFNVGTSDQNADWEAMTPEDFANVQKGLAGRISEKLGINQFAMRNRPGGNHYPELTWDETKKAWFDPDPNGRVYYDREGWMLDANGKRVGGTAHYSNPNHKQIATPFATTGTGTSSPQAPTGTTTSPATTPSTSGDPGVHMPGEGGVDQTGTGVPAAPAPPGAPPPPNAPPPVQTQPPVPPVEGGPAPIPTHPNTPAPEPRPGDIPNPGPGYPGGQPLPEKPGGPVGYDPRKIPGNTGPGYPGGDPSMAAAPPPPPPPPPSPANLAAVPPGGTLPTSYGQINRMPDGSLKLITNDVGAQIHAKAMQRLEKEYGQRLFAGVPGAPRPEIIPGKHNYNPFSGRFVR